MADASAQKDVPLHSMVHSKQKVGRVSDMVIKGASLLFCQSLNQLKI